MIENQEPLKGGKTQTFTNHELKGGARLTGWIAGKTKWINCHYRDRSIPCFEVMTGGALPCRFNHDYYFPELQGYTPILDLSGKRWFVIVKSYSRDVVDALPIWSPVVAYRAKGVEFANVIVEARTGDHYKARPGTKLEPFDISAALLVCWKEPELVRWFADQARADQVQTPTGPTAPVENPAEQVQKDEGKTHWVKGVEKLHRRMVEKRAEEIGQMPDDDKRSRNGTH